MQQVTVGTRYQIVIPKEVRRKIKGIRPGAKVNITAENEKVFKAEAEQISWSDRTYGLMKDAWKNIDPIRELEKMRNEWD